MTAAQAARDALAKVPAGKIRLRLQGDPAYHDTLRAILGSAPKLEVTDEGAPLTVGIAQEGDTLKLTGDLQGEGKLAAWTSLLPAVASWVERRVRAVLAIFSTSPWVPPMRVTTPTMPTSENVKRKMKPLNESVRLPQI